MSKWDLIFFNGGAIVLAILFIVVATRKEARGVFQLFLWFVAISMLLMEAGCWILLPKIGHTLN